MSPTILVLWLANLLLDTGGQLAFKKAADEHGDQRGFACWHHMAARPWLWIGLICYAGCFLNWIAFLSLVPLSVGVLLSSINIVALMVAARWLFEEKLSLMQVTGMLLVCLGVAIVGVGR